MTSGDQHVPVMENGFTDGTLGLPSARSLGVAAPHGVEYQVGVHVLSLVGSLPPTWHAFVGEREARLLLCPKVEAYKGGLVFLSPARAQRFADLPDPRQHNPTTSQQQVKYKSTTNNNNVLFIVDIRISRHYLLLLTQIEKCLA